MKKTARVGTVLLALAGSSVSAADWPWIYGPRRDHTSQQQGLLRSWPQEGPKVLWTVPVGAGFGGPAVDGGQVYLLDRDEKIGDTLRVLDLASGKELWTFAYDAATGKLLRRFEPSAAGLSTFTFAPDGRTIASGNVDGSISLWEIASGKERCQFKVQEVKPKEKPAENLPDKEKEKEMAKRAAEFGALPQNQRSVTFLRYSPDGGKIPHRGSPGNRRPREKFAPQRRTRVDLRGLPEPLVSVPGPLCATINPRGVFARRPV